MTDAEKLLQRAAVLLLDSPKTLHHDGAGMWVHGSDCGVGGRCSCGALYVAFTTDRDGDITVHEVRNSGKLRVRIGEGSR
ncbi:MAG TPA: hypothetical protein VFT22_07145 [Kofleriaceae bacterium]|nr:hypothetical protein [Kofleriaceae bacterium]